MISIQRSSYGVSAMVSSLMPATAKNGEANPGPNKASGKAEGTRPAGGPPPGTPPPGAGEAAKTSDDSGTTLTLLETDEKDGFAETEAPTWEEFEAAARYLEEVVDLREEDDADGLGSNNSGITFDEAGTYRPAWIR